MLNEEDYEEEIIYYDDYYDDYANDTTNDNEISETNNSSETWNSNGYEIVTMTTEIQKQADSTIHSSTENIETSSMMTEEVTNVADVSSEMDQQSNSTVSSSETNGGRLE